MDFDLTWVRRGSSFVCACTSNARQKAPASHPSPRAQGLNYRRSGAEHPSRQDLGTRPEAGPGSFFRSQMWHIALPFWERTPAPQEFLLRSTWPQDGPPSHLIDMFAPSGPAPLGGTAGGARPRPSLSSRGDWVPDVRERLRKHRLRVCDGSRACVRGSLFCGALSKRHNSRPGGGVPGRANVGRVRAPGTPAGHFFVAGRCDQACSHIPNIARCGVGTFCRSVPRGEPPASSWSARPGSRAPGRALDKFAPDDPVGRLTVPRY